MAVFHVTFSDSDHLRGRPVDFVYPLPLGPRNCHQFSPAETGASTRNKKAKQANRLTKLCMVIGKTNEAFTLKSIWRERLPSA
jgi:hypothetical protein